MANIQTGGNKSVMGAIMNGAHNHKIVTIMYLDSKGNTSSRDTEPYEIKDGMYWAYCLMNNGIRQFKLSQIMQASVTSHVFTPRFPIKIV